MSETVQELPVDVSELPDDVILRVAGVATSTPADPATSATSSVRSIPVSGPVAEVA